MSSPAARGVTTPSGQTSSSPSSSTQPSDRTTVNTQGLSSRAGADSRASTRGQQDTSIGAAATAASGDNGQDDDDDGEDQPCQACGVFPARFQCSACQSVRYCSQECQASDWKIHYRECAEIVAAQKEEQTESQQGTGRPRSGTNGASEMDAPGDRYSTDMEMTSRAAASPSRSGVAGNFYFCYFVVFSAVYVCPTWLEVVAATLTMVRTHLFVVLLYCWEYWDPFHRRSAGRRRRKYQGNSESTSKTSKRTTEETSVDARTKSSIRGGREDRRHEVLYASDLQNHQTRGSLHLSQYPLG